MALKSTIAAALFALTMVFVPGAPEAEAKTKVVIGIGTGPYVGHCYNRNGRRCGWHPRPHHFYYVPRHRPVYYYDYRAPAVHKMSCRSAARMVDHSGFNKVKARDCSGKIYSFRARKKGHNYIVKVNAYTRRIIGVGRI